MNLIINVHSQDQAMANDVDRRHYTVKALIAELSKYDDNDELVIRDLNTGKFGSIDFQGLTLA